jgi:hypothetical protein
MPLGRDYQPIAILTSATVSDTGIEKASKSQSHHHRPRFGMKRLGIKFVVCAASFMVN